MKTVITVVVGVIASSIVSTRAFADIPDNPNPPTIARQEVCFFQDAEGKPCSFRCGNCGSQNVTEVPCFPADTCNAEEIERLDNYGTCDRGICSNLSDQPPPPNPDGSDAGDANSDDDRAACAHARGTQRAFPLAGAAIALLLAVIASRRRARA